MIWSVMLIMLLLGWWLLGNFVRLLLVMFVYDCWFVGVVGILVFNCSIFEGVMVVNWFMFGKLVRNVVIKFIWGILVGVSVFKLVFRVVFIVFLNRIFSSFGNVGCVM